MVTWSTRRSMILLLRSSRSFSKSFIFRSISSSSVSTSAILTASASPSFTRPRCRPSTWMNSDYNRINGGGPAEHKVYKWCRCALSTFLCTSKLHDYGDLSSALWEIFMCTFFVLTFRMQDIFLCLSKVSIRVASWSSNKSNQWCAIRHGWGLFRKMEFLWFDLIKS